MLPARMVSGDRYLYCPYDDTHEILAKSFSAHLIKCRKNYPGQKLVSCPLDSTHKIPKPEIPYHVSVCDKRYLMDRERQKRAGENGLKGDVIGPPVVSDHFAGQEREEEESWDDFPSGAFVTPALFNQKPSTTQENYSPPGGYVPKQKEESIRKVPNAPAKAATLSNPASSQTRVPGPNQVFNYSLGLTDAGRGSGMMGKPVMNATRPGNFMARPSLGAGLMMPGVLPPSGQNQGPRFIGRGVSKYATKSQPNAPGMTHQTNDLLASPPSSKIAQFDDKTAGTDLSERSDLISPQRQQQNFTGQGDNKNKKEEEKTLSEEELAINQLQTSIMLHQHKQLKQLKEQQKQQELELAKKHELQLLQLRQLQNTERQKLLEQQDKVEQELVTRNAVNLSLSTAGALTFPHQSLLTPAMLKAIEEINGGQGLTGLMGSGMNPLGDTTGSHLAETNTTAVQEADRDKEGHSGPQASRDVESLSASLSKVSTTQNSTMGDDAVGNVSQSDVVKLRRKLQKKLKEIEILEQKSCLGHRLNPDEETKLSSKAEVLTQLKQVGQS